MPCANAAKVERPPLRWLRGDGNFTKASRTPSSIRYVVVHATEGPFWGSVWWLKNAQSKASSNYLVSREGDIIQLVHLSDVAWHTGNADYNRQSVGIEQEGSVDDPAGFSNEEYRSTARLAAWLARRSLIPIDRKHFIGHSEVPDPFNPGLYGGADHHTDPGPHWNWARFLALVRRYANPVPEISVRSSTLYRGQIVTGGPPWEVQTKGPVKRVEFLVDGKLLWTDHKAPFSFAGGRGWKTLGLRNGRHVLTLRAYGPQGARAARSMGVRVRNRAFELTTAGVRRGQEVKGVLRLRADARGAQARSVRLYLDGRLLSVDERKPFAFRWDTRKLVDGTHTLDLKTKAYDGRTASRRFRLVVANAPKPQIVGQSLEDGQVVDKPVDWSVFVKKPVQRVDFLVDGIVVGSTATIPYSFTWDPAGLAPGAHTLEAKVVGTRATVDAPQLQVTVAAPGLSAEAPASDPG